MSRPGVRGETTSHIRRAGACETLIKDLAAGTRASRRRASTGGRPSASPGLGASPASPGSAVALVTLKKRAEFLRLRGGARCATPAFVLETKPQIEAARTSSEPRFGFTVTKSVGGAVMRNRIKRRLRAAVCAVAPLEARPAHDYVLIARTVALERPFADLKKDLERAFQRVHQPAQPRHRKRQR